ncbi:malate dehydrogenase (oxaloacetate-decarboxylating) [Desulfonatronum thiosulfatophilum]|uniref:Malate dehydrogenase (Oxaloacetate-decarboxylating) n=1 Tax=Desulfonatronum thiosulfatophilum TaxID=617002 RepID=A0A1G6BAQ5_9BACT|nr:malic enzyme-like NAD(P)-binding protein [Desulfonatronum thiosulfatophilum]SDB17711.1 malate dehydrogenase (oxaloacetate-decarboxylating) [Desulfonatronum thiosulfatophilum]
MSTHFSASYSFTMDIRLEKKQENRVRLLETLGREGARLIQFFRMGDNMEAEEITIEFYATSVEHGEKVVAALQDLPGVLESWATDTTMAIHDGGKLEISPTSSVDNADELAMAYTPGVARVCQEIHKNPERAFDLTIRQNCVAVVSDGTAVLGLGNIGPLAAMPVMEGKAVLFKAFGRVDAFPLCVKTKTPEELIDFVEKVAPSFGGINLEDIAAPACFQVEQELKKRLDIPVFHDDQHGTAVVALAALLNSLKLSGKKIGELKMVINGFGAAGVACAKMFAEAGVKNIIPCDRAGAIYRGRTQGMNSVKEECAQIFNPNNEQGSLSEVIQGADIFIGLSGPGTLKREDVLKMAPKPIIFAMANPIPEILPEEIADLDCLIATGRSDYPNQINNVLCFPGIFRGALDCRASDINEAMKLAAAQAIADCVDDEQLAQGIIIPSAFHPGVADFVAERVEQAARDSGVARI